jgi:MFS family permease
MSDDAAATDNAESQALPAWSDLFAGRSAVYSVALGGSVALHAVNIYVASTIMPSAVQDIGGLDYYAWSTTLFVLASILGSALSARLLQRAGARAAYGIAALIFASGTLICALAPSMPVLLAGRFVQGFGGGFLYALAYGVMRLIFPQPLWSRVVGLISAMWGIATLVGPAVGGIFAQLGAWRAAFWSLIPVAALFALMAVVSLPGREAKVQDMRPLPLLQLLLLSAAVLLLSVGSIGHDLVWNLLSVGGTGIALGLLVAVEARSPARLLPTGALSVVAPLGALYATIALLMVGMQPSLFVPYLLQRLHGQPPLVAGYLAALLALGWTLGSTGSATWQTAGARRGIVVGPILCLFGLGLLALLLPVNSAGAWRVLLPACLGLVAVGLGIGFTWPHLVTRVFRLAPAAEHDLAAAAITTVQLSAAALGAALAGMVANLGGMSHPGGVAGASNAAGWLFGLFVLAPLLAVATALRVARGTQGWR